jgi:3-oxoacyl-[acyl-carrier protein] reductase
VEPPQRSKPTLRAIGALHVVVHCAGILMVVPTIETTDDDWERVIDTNLNGTFYVCRAAACAMAERRSGRIIMVTSGLGVAGSANNAAYAASKGGVNAFMRSLAREVQSLGIRVNAINPGPTDTPLMRQLPREMLPADPDNDPQHQFNQPSDAADLVLFLATTAAPVTGQVVQINSP